MTYTTHFEATRPGDISAKVCSFDASIDVPALTGEQDETVSIYVNVWIDGFENETCVKWMRSYPVASGYNGLASEWDTPRIEMSSWDAHNGTLKRAQLVSAYDALYEVCEAYFARYLKGQ